MRFHINSINNLAEAAIMLLEFAGNEKTFLFFGEMGVGKTTLIKAICDELRVTDVVTSPSYSIVNEYASSGGNTIYHFDFYRIKTETEVYDIGFEEYLYSGNLCLIEWPEKISNLWPDRYVYISLSLLGDDSREITADIRGKNL